MYYPVEMVVANYKPLRLEAGMLFLTKIHQGTIKELIEIWALSKLPPDREEFLVKNGYPITIYIVRDSNGETLAEGAEIGWWDAGDDVDELRDISLKEINTILNDYEGILEMDFIETEDRIFIPRFVQEKVILRLLHTEEENEE
jgi:hypothetical protein